MLAPYIKAKIITAQVEALEVTIFSMIPSGNKNAE